jgi:hypothetical protein
MFSLLLALVKIFAFFWNEMTAFFEEGYDAVAVLA